MTDRAPNRTHGPRHSIHAHPAFSVGVERAPGLSPSLIRADLLDLSPGGAKLSANSAVSFQEAITLKLENTLAGQQLSIEGQVRWIRQGPSNNWILGCSFNHALPDDEFEHLFAASVAERRRSPRRVTATPATVDWELGERGLDVNLQNLSKGGFCIKCPREGKIDGRLHLTVGVSPQRRCRVRATARWQRPLDDGYLIGCEFLEASNFQVVQAAMEPRELPFLASAPVVRRISNLALLGIVIFLLWLWAFYF